MAYTTNVKKVIQVAYVQNVIKIIDLNVDLCFLIFYPSSDYFKSSLKIRHVYLGY